MTFEYMATSGFQCFGTEQNSVSLSNCRTIVTKTYTHKEVSSKFWVNYEISTICVPSEPEEGFIASLMYEVSVCSAAVGR